MKAPVRLVFALVVAVCLWVVFFWRLGAPTFWDPDEAHYAQTSREMIASGDWWAPSYNGEPFFDKPALFHQLQGLSMLVFGQTELAARLVPALAALGLIAITAWFGATMVSLEIGMIAGLLLAASPGVFALARYAILDTVFTLFLFGGVSACAVAALRDRPRLQWLGYAFLALAVMTKGPLAVVLSGLSLVLAVGVSRDLRRRLLGLRWLAGLAIVIAAASPWFIYMYGRFGREFVNGYFLDENILLFGSRRFGNQPGGLFYLRVLATGMLPWTGLLVGRLIDDVRARVRGERGDGLDALLWIWIAVIVGFFSLSAFKLDHYVFPAAPAACLLCARAFEDARRQPADPRHAWSRWGVWSVGPVFVVLGLVSGYIVIARLALPAAALAAPIAMIVAGGGVALTGRWRAHAPWIVSGATVVVYLVLVGTAIPALEAQKVVADLARLAGSRAHADEPVVSYRLNRWDPSVRFYANRATTFVDDADEAAVVFAAAPAFHALMLRRDYDNLVARGVPLRIVAARNGMWFTTGRALWRSFTPTAQFLVVTKAQ